MKVKKIEEFMRNASNVCNDIDFEFILSKSEVDQLMGDEGKAAVSKAIINACYGTPAAPISKILYQAVNQRVEEIIRDAAWNGAFIKITVRNHVSVHSFEAYSHQDLVHV